MTLYEQVLEREWKDLDARLQFFHRETGRPWQGHARVQWTRNPLLRLALWLSPLPREAERVALQFRFRDTPNCQYWERRFADRPSVSTQFVRNGKLFESFGAATGMLTNKVLNGALAITCERFQLWRIPVPGLLGLCARAHEWAEGRRIHFDVRMYLFNALLLRYTGSLAETDVA